MTLGVAIALASELFKTKLDKGGQPYILHCLRVMNNVPDYLKIPAIGHDWLEDCPITKEDLKEKRFSSRDIEIIDILTHKKDVSYDDYIKRIAMDKDATLIKIQDLIDNSNITRLKGLRKKDFDRIERYHRAFVYLSGI